MRIFSPYLFAIAAFLALEKINVVAGSGRLYYRDLYSMIFSLKSFKVLAGYNVKKWLLGVL